MDEETFQKRLQELIKEIMSLPANKQQRLAPLVNETKLEHNEIKENTCKITKSLADLQICLKYVLFDLEATRRERDMLKTALDNKKDDGTDKIDGEM